MFQTTSQPLNNARRKDFMSRSFNPNAPWMVISTYIWVNWGFKGWHMFKHLLTEQLLGTHVSESQEIPYQDYLDYYDTSTST